jgi:uncharacterized protein DUF6602
MPNAHVLQRLAGIQSILNGVHAASAGLSSATVGQQRAAFINDYLAEVLPPVYRFGSGDVTDVAGNKSGQLDIVVEYPFSPTLPLTGTQQPRLYLAEGVAAVIEVKSDLSAQWQQALHTATQLAPVQRSFAATMSFGPSPQTNIPLFAVGYTGWSTMNALQTNLSSVSDVFGALVLDAGLYASKSGIAAVGAQALWCLICDLHRFTTSLQGAGTNPIQYVI